LRFLCGILSSLIQMLNQKQSPFNQPSTRHARVSQALLEDISAGRYEVGARLPSEAELEKRFGVSRHTVREAMRRLRDLGVVSARAGIGTTRRACNCVWAAGRAGEKQPGGGGWGAAGRAGGRR
jgi:DNA-binding transcriptional MocR family regulator